MIARALPAALLLTIAMSACSGTTPNQPASGSTGPEDSGLMTQVVVDAGTVVEDMNPRTAELESMLP